MTSKAMQTYADLTKALERVRECAQYGIVPSISMPQLDDALCAHLEALNEKITGLCNDVKRAEQEFEKKDAALKIAGEELRAAQEKASSFARQLAGTEEGPALMTILGALVDAQRIMTYWLVPDGVRARDTVKALLPVLDNQALVLAMREFEKPRNDRN